MYSEIIENYILHNLSNKTDYSALMTHCIHFNDIPATGKIAVMLQPTIGNYTCQGSLHSHDYFEIIYIYKGTAVQYLKNSTRQLQEGDICIMNTNYKHGLNAPDKNSAIFNILIASEIINSSFINLITENDLFCSFFINSLFSLTNEEAIYFSPNENTNVELYMRLMIEEYILQKPCYQSAMQNYLSLIFTNILRGHIYTIDNSLENDMNATNILTYLSAHLKDISLNSLAGHFHYTPTHLSQIIKLYFGKSPTKLINELRLNKAAEYLRNTTIGINEISKLLGYYDRSYFNRCFHKFYGVTPNEYRIMKHI